MDNTETQETYSQTRENRRGNQGWTIQRHKKHSQTRENRRGNQGWTIQRHKIHTVKPVLRGHLLDKEKVAL